MFEDVSHVLAILLSEAKPFVQFLQRVCPIILNYGEVRFYCYSGGVVARLERMLGLCARILSPIVPVSKV